MKLSKKEQEQLKQVFQPPEPEKKREFLRTLPKQKPGFGTLLLSQAAYIRPWVWATSFLMFGAGALFAAFLNMDTVWFISAITPFMALLLLLELARSSAYGMAELELSTRFSLRTILMARMVMLGAAQLSGLVITVFVAGSAGKQMLQKGMYLLVPYLMTTLLGLVVLRRIQGKEGMAACGAVSAFVSVLLPLSRIFLPELYGKEARLTWILAALLLLGSLCREYTKTMNFMEDTKTGGLYGISR